MNITFNNKTPEDLDAWLATIPTLTHSEIKGTSIDIPYRDGMLSDEGYRGDATWNMMFHLKNSEVEKKKRKLRQWLKGTGVLVMSGTPDSYFEVKKVILTEDYDKSDDYGRINTQFVCYPYEFLNSGNTEIDGDGTIENEHDPSMPLFKIVGNGTGTLTVNSGAMTFTVTTADQGLYIDTRKFIAYNNSGANKNGVLSGNYEDIRLKTGDNIISITDGFDLITYPRWGYVV